MPKLIVLAFTCVLTLFASRPLAAADRWVRVTTEHFETVGNGTDISVRRVAQTLEQFHTVVVTNVLNGAGSAPSRTAVLVFKDAQTFRAHMPPGRNSDFIGGWTSVSDTDTLLALNGENIGVAMRTVLAGYSYSIVAHTLGAAPPWLLHGIAEVYRTFEERQGGKGALIGRPDQDNVNVLRNGTLLPVATLVGTAADDPRLAPGGVTRDMFDAEAWALVHYLSFGARPGQLNRYIAELRAGTPSADAFTHAFGDTATLDHELNDYIRKFIFPALQVAFDEKVTPALPSKGDALGPADAEAYLGALLASTGQADKALERLSKALQAQPGSARALATQGTIDLSRNDRENGLVLLERAATLAPKDEVVQARLGHHLALGLMRAPRPLRVEAVEHARDVLDTAVGLDADNTLASAELGWILLQDPDDPARAVTLLSDAVKRSPQQEVYRRWLADALSRNGDSAQARALLGPLMARGSTAAIRDDARRLLGAMSERQKRTPELAPLPR